MHHLNGSNFIDLVVLTESGLYAQYNTGGNFTLPFTVYSADDIYDYHVTDLFSDGDLDIVGITSSSEGVMCYNDGTGAFSNLTNQSFDIPRAGEIELMDFVTGQGSQGMLLLETDNGMRLTKSTNIPQINTIGETVFDFNKSNSGSFEMISSDLNNDGLSDVIISSRGLGRIYYLLRSSLNGFEMPPRSMLLSGEIDNGAAVDFNQDGLTDVLFTHSNDDRITAYENLGQGAAWTPKVMVPFVSDPLNAQMTDVNQDGHLDIIATTSDLGTPFYYFLNDGNSEFGPAVPLPTSSIPDFSAPIYDYAIAELDGQAGEDIIFAGFVDGTDDTFQAILYKNNGTGYTAEDLGTFDGNTNAGPISSSGTRVHLSDVDQDGDEDIIVMNVNEWSSGGKVFLLLRNGNSYGAPLLILDNVGEGRLNTADVNSDGYPDIVFDRFSGLGAYINDGTGAFNNSITWLTNGIEGHNSGILEDFDNDGLKDYLYMTFLSKNIQWRRNLGNSSFSDPLIWGENNQGFNYFCLDFDNDGDKDVIFSTSDRHNIERIENRFGENSISGKTFFDENQDGIQDSDEPTIGIPVIIDPLTQVQYSQEGEFYFAPLDEGEYNISSQVPDGWFVTTNPSTYNISVDDTTYQSGLCFGLSSNEDILDGQVQVTTGYALCLEEAYIQVSVANTGSVYADAEVTLSIPGVIAPYSFPGFPIDSILNDSTFQWNLNDIPPFTTITIVGIVQNPSVGEDAVLGEIFEFNAKAILSPSDTNISLSPIISEHTYSTEFLCAYDPNDKTVFPYSEAEGNPTDLGETLRYTIRFQNTGNFYATDVIIRDTLDPNLDVSTFQFMGSSHPDVLSISIDDGQYLTFTFRNIMLPDSTTNFLGSQGFVAYSIMPNASAGLGTEIFNTASIYFDQNPAIVTNTVQSTLADVTSLSDIQQGIQFSLFPNPSHNTVSLDIPSQTPIHLIEVYNGRLEVVQSRTNPQNRTWNVADWNNGVYYFVLRNKDGEILGTNRFIKIE